VADDGPGFDPDILGRVGEPYVTTRPRHADSEDGEDAGLGLGFFIAKTLLERTGATLRFRNRASPQRGAVITLRWNRADFERSAVNAGVTVS